MKEQGEELRKYVIQTNYKAKYELEKDLSSSKDLEVVVSLCVGDSGEG